MYNYDELFDKIALPAGAAEIFHTVTGEVGRERMDSLSADFFAGKDIYDAVGKMAEDTGAEKDELWMVVTLYFTAKSHDIYAERGISDDIFYDSMGDITVWVKVCRRDWGCWGIHNNEFGWMEGTLRATRFKLGRFQFELSTFKCDRYEKYGTVLHRGDRVVNMHIPEGEPMTPERRYDSYRRGLEFWGGNVIVCDTWLFYPRHREFLQPNSNILGLMDDFDIIESDESDSLGNMWRIFNRRDSYIPSELPRNTGMRRAYADWLEKVGKTGSGYGVRVESGLPPYRG